MEENQFKASFTERLRILRNKRDVSAREMSLALGQNVNYINLIENGRRLPSMEGFFSICEYLGLTPADFFERQEPTAVTAQEILDAVGALPIAQQRSLIDFLQSVKKR